MGVLSSWKTCQSPLCPVGEGGVCAVGIPDAAVGDCVYGGGVELVDYRVQLEFCRVLPVDQLVEFHTRIKCDDPCVSLFGLLF